MTCFKYHLTTNTFALIKVLSQHKTVVKWSNSNDYCQQKIAHADN